MEEYLSIAALKEEGELMNDSVTGLTKDMNVLENTFKTMKDTLTNEDTSFLIEIDVQTKETQRPLPDDLKEGLKVDEYLDNMIFSV